MNEDEELVAVKLSPEDDADIDVFDLVIHRLMGRCDNDKALAVLADRMVTALGMLICYGAQQDRARLDAVLPRFVAALEKSVNDCFASVETQMAEEEAKGTTIQ